jgi:hypothetical protein
MLVIAITIGTLIGSLNIPKGVNIAENQENMDILRTDLYIPEFADEDMLILTNY